MGRYQYEEIRYLAQCAEFQQSAGVRMIAMPFLHFDVWRRLKFDDNCLCKKRFQVPNSIRLSEDRIQVPVLLALEYYKALFEGFLNHEDTKVAWVRWNLCSDPVGQFAVM